MLGLRHRYLLCHTFCSQLCTQQVAPAWRTPRETGRFQIQLSEEVIATQRRSTAIHKAVPAEGLEPSRPLGQRILNPSRLPNSATRANGWEKENRACHGGPQSLKNPNSWPGVQVPGPAGAGPSSEKVPPRSIAASRRDAALRHGGGLFTLLAREPSSSTPRSSKTAAIPPSAQSYAQRAGAEAT